MVRGEVTLADRREVGAGTRELDGTSHLEAGDVRADRIGRRGQQAAAPCQDEPHRQLPRPPASCRRDDTQTQIPQSVDGRGGRASVGCGAVLDFQLFVSRTSGGEHLTPGMTRNTAARQ